jgi:RecA-family ATPase
MHSFEEARSILSNRVLEIVSYLFPNGKKIGQEWCVGSINGEAGESLKIRLSGQKSGIWSDFNGGKGGDLIDLWSKKNGISLSEALKEINEYLGNKSFNSKITINNPSSKSTKYTLPSPKNLVELSNNSPIKNYLITERCLIDEIINKFKISERGNDIVFPFFEDDVLTHIKYLSIHRHGENKKKIISSSPNSKPILFGWQTIPSEATSIIICEGEIDAMSLCQYGLHALSVPTGAGKGAKQNWFEHEKERLEKYETIYLCFDPDEPGQQSIDAIANLCGKNRCKVVILPHKDPNECLQNGITIEQMYEYLQKAKYYEESEDKNNDPVNSSINNNREIIVENLSDIIHLVKPINWLWKDKVAYSMVTLFAGQPGLGKSQLLLHIASIVSSGGKFHFEESNTDKNRVLLISGEDSKEHTLIPRLIASGANKENIDILNGIKTIGRSGRIFYDYLSIVDDVDSFEELIIKNNYKLIIFDPISLYIGSADDSKSKDIRKVIGILQQLAEKLNLAIILNTHFSKSSGHVQRSAIERVLGSISYVAACRTVMGIFRDKDNHSRVLFLPIKNNVGSDRGGFVYEIEQFNFINQQNGETINTSRIKWLNEKIDTLADEALNSSPKESPRYDEASEFLAQLLSDGEKSYREIRQKFIEYGFGIKTLYKARDQLKIRIRECEKNKRDTYWSIIKH